MGHGKTAPRPLHPGALTDVEGLKVGHWTSSQRPTGCTVVLCEQGAVAAVDVRGAAPGTRETDLLEPDNLVEKVHAVLLTGGSAFGLDAAGGVMRWLEERGHGLEVADVRVPIVPGAVLFDLWPGEGHIRPNADSGYAACTASSADPPAQGSVGAGAGARVGKLFGLERAMRGGIGTASVRVDGITVAAMVAVNAVGDVIDPASGRVLAGARAADGRTLMGSTSAMLRGEKPVSKLIVGVNTTIGIVATNATLTKAQARRLAGMSHDGLARSVDPVHTMTDGDSMFALATCRAAPGAIHLTVLGAIAARVTSLAVCNAVASATGLPGLPAERDL